ncbi:MAG: AI-2E family transporter [Anaeromyxobacteraceae bacterium]
MTSRHAPRLIVALLLAALALTGAILLPFWVAIFFAAVLTAAFRPWMEWLTAKLRGRREAAAAILTVALVVVVVAPIATFGTMAVRGALDGLTWLREALDSEGIGGLLARLPGPLEQLARKLVAAIPQPQAQLQKLAGEQGGQAAAAVGGVLAATGSFLFQATMMLVAFFFLLVDGARLVAWLDRHVPLGPGQFRQLLTEFRQTSVSVLFATVATAGIQTVTAFVGYLVFGAPRIAFLTAATFVVAMIPAAGGAFMVVFAGILMIAGGDTISGALLIGWGVVVVSIMDNVARPFLLKGGMELHGGVVFFALLGGLAVFGAIGLVIGPLAVTFLVSVMRMYEREFSPAGELVVPPLREEGDAREPPR